MSLASQVTAGFTRVGAVCKDLTARVSSVESGVFGKRWRATDFEMSNPFGAFAINATWDGTDWRYINSGRAFLIQPSAGNIAIRTAVSGTAGQVISFLDRGFIGDSGVLTYDSLTAYTEWSTTNPLVPTTGVKVFARLRGRRMLAFMGPDGQEAAVQPGLFSNRVVRVAANNGSTTVSLDGVVMSVQNGTSTTAVTAVSAASTSFYTSLARFRVAAQTTAGTSATVRSTAAQWFLSSTAKMGGFYFVARFGLATVASGNRVFVGLHTAVANIGNVDPSSLLNMVGFGANAADANLQFMVNDGTGTATKVDLGTNFPAASAGSTYFYEVRLWAPSGSAASIQWSIERLNDGIKASGSATTDLPTAGTMMAAHLWHNNGATTTAVAMDVQSLYVETDN